MKHFERCTNGIIRVAIGINIDFFICKCIAGDSRHIDLMLKVVIGGRVSMGKFVWQN